MTELLQSSGVFLAGVLVRLGLLLLGIAAVVVPALLVALGLRRWEAWRARRLGIRAVAGLPFRPDVAYAPGHVWVRRRAHGVELGLDGLAQQLLPSATSVEPIRPGTGVRRGDVVAVVRSGERELPLYAPVAGTVLGVNAAALRTPELVRREGCGRGWIVLFAPAEEASLSGLPTGEAAEAWLRREAERIARFLEERLGFAAADGGALVAPAPWLLGDAGYRALCESVLRPRG
jgi:glycine cleavage system H lipoate-binding protein